MRACRPSTTPPFRTDLDAGELAAALIESWEGAALRGKVTRSRAPYERFEAVTVPALLR
jgi:TetR/AcrR family transcriptional repressor of nem operon